MGSEIIPKHILIARTDSIGDVMLTLPLTTYLKQKFPGVKISFLGQSYTKPVIECCRSVDAIYEWNKISGQEKSKQIELVKNIGADTVIHVFPRKEVVRICKKAGIKNRIATSHRIYTWLTCNYRVNFDRRKSDLHESQLNFKLLQPLGINEIPSKKEIIDLYNFHSPELNTEMKSLLKPGKFHLILHPKSKGSAREWGMENFAKLIQLLPADKFEIFISGVKEDGDLLSAMKIDSNRFSNVHLIAGKYTLKEFISFISICDGLVAASTGPLHIAAALGIHAVGLFVPLRPMHPGRWEPIGKNAIAVTGRNACDGCPVPQDCACMKAITPESVAQQLMRQDSRMQ